MMEVIAEEDIKIGPLRKRETGLGVKWRERFFVVTNKSNLHWFKDQKEAAASRRKPKAKSTILLQNVTVRTSNFNPTCNDAPIPSLCFQLVSTDAPQGPALLSVCASTEQERADWLDVISGATAGRKDLTKATVQITEELRRSGQNIPPEDLEFASSAEIGSGASGVVKRGIWLKTTEVAVKALKNLPEFTDITEMLSFYKEIETLSKLRHVNIVQMYGFCKKGAYLCLVTEFVRGGNLSKYLQDPQSKTQLDLGLQIELVLNICRGMVYLHNQGVIHRDLKPANILVESWEEGRVKVCDFGLSTVGQRTSHSSSGSPSGGTPSDTSPSETGLGSPQYAAPELATENHDKQVDVFSFAIILWEIALHESPWPEIKFGSQFAERYRKGERPRIPLTNIWRNLIEKCWDGVPSRRPSFVEIYEEVERLKSQHSEEISAARASTPTTPGRHPSGHSFLYAENHSNSSFSLSPATSHNGGNSNSPIVPPAAPTASKAEALLNGLFADGKETVTWDKFSTTFQVALGTNLLSANKLRYILDPLGLGQVKQGTWASFLSWFSPLAVANAYQTVQDDGYDIAQILEICSPPWFHGFLGAPEAQANLKQKSPNTFLIRFSSTPGSYALSVSYGSSVGHWRIACERKPYSAPVFKIDVREYRSLEDIVRTHGPGKEPLRVKSGESCYLEFPFVRAENNYANP